MHSAIILFPEWQRTSLQRLKIMKEKNSGSSTSPFFLASVAKKASKPHSFKLEVAKSHGGLISLVTSNWTPWTGKPVIWATSRTVGLISPQLNLKQLNKGSQKTNAACISLGF